VEGLQKDVVIDFGRESEPIHVEKNGASWKFLDTV
jgi:hypothetical protein